MKLFITGLLLAGSFSSYAFTKIPVSWECVLSSKDTVVCSELKKTFSEANTGFSISPKDQARLNVRIGYNQLNEFTEYVVRLTLKGQPEKEYKKKVSDSLSAFEKTEKVSGFIQITVNAAKEEIDYQEEPKKDKPYYIEPAVEIEGGKRPGSNSQFGYGEVMANYSKPDYRIVADVWGTGKKDQIEENTYTKEINTSEVRYGFSGGGAYSINQHVSIGAFAGYTQTRTNIVTEEDLGIPDSALQNTATKASARVGVEWIQHPIINDKTNGNFALRGYVVGEHHEYLDPQTFEFRKETFGRPTIDASYTHQFKTVNLEGTVSAYRSVGREDKELQGVQFVGKANFNIKDTIILQPNFKLDYTENRIRTTAGTRYSFLDLTGTQPNDKVTYQYGVTLKIPLGNARLSRQERRWKD